MKLSKNKIKRIVLSVLAMLLMTSILSGCSLLDSIFNNNNGISLGDLDGTSAAKLLLANKRLDTGLLDNDNIFASGSQTFRALAKKAAANRKPASDKKLVGSFTSSNGEAVWSDFDEYNNEYQYFEEITSVIVSTATAGANVIDDIKENVSVVDTWVEYLGNKYYLSVSASSETICRVTDVELFICKRYTNESGKTVYEIYMEQELATQRVKYIPGERYEFTQLMPFVDQELYFVADHSKGYWETMVANDGGGFYNLSYNVMKSDICYMVNYQISEEYIANIAIMSSDTNTEFFRIDQSSSDLWVTLQFSGFDGIDRVTAPMKSVDSNNNLTDPEAATVHLTNGKRIVIGNTYVEGSVEICGLHVVALTSDYIGSLEIRISGETDEEKWANFASFLSETGLKCRRNWNTVYSGIDVAKEDAKDLVKYYQWNGYTISNATNIVNAVVAEKKEIVNLKQIYNDVKDGDVVVKGLFSGSIDIRALNFASIKDMSSEGVDINGKQINISSLSLTVDDMTLFDSGKSYVIAFAMYSDRADDMVIIGRGEGNTYEGGSSFTVNAKNVTLTLPDMAAAEYTLVAFVATDDGIRVSASSKVRFDSVSENDIYDIAQHITLEKNSDGTLKITYNETDDRTCTVQSRNSFSYDEMVEMMSVSVFMFGTPSSERIERLTDDGTYTEVSRDETLSSGEYRMAYIIRNGDRVKTGYVYITYTVIG